VHRFSYGVPIENVPRSLVAFSMLNFVPVDGPGVALRGAASAVMMACDNTSAS